MSNWVRIRKTPNGRNANYSLYLGERKDIPEEYKGRVALLDAVMSNSKPREKTDARCIEGIGTMFPNWPGTHDGGDVDIYYLD